MFVCLHKDTYVAPHFHKNKTESYHIIEGKVDIYFFNKKGKYKIKFYLIQNQKSKFLSEIISKNISYISTKNKICYFS